MWNVRHHYLEPDRTLQLRFYAEDTCLSYTDFLQALVDEPDFRNLMLAELRDAPFTAYRWETPPVGTNTLNQPFACLLHDSPDLDVRADRTDFETYFSSQEAVCFENLGKDALLVAPCPVSDSANYSHIASFHRSAPLFQQHAFWSLVAKTVLRRIDSKPLWLSTAGGGVDWLHLRLDERPKYYLHQAWRESSNTAYAKFDL